MNFIILGAPGAGKGTQARLLSERFKLAKISTGEILRKSVREKTELGKQAEVLLNAGKYVSDELAVALVEDELRSNELAKNNGFILDGFPRTVKQGEALTDLLKKSHSKIDAAILLNVSEEELLERFKGRSLCGFCGAPYHQVFAKPKTPGVCDSCGHNLEIRSDDTPEVVRKRLEVFQELTIPVIEYYRRKGLLVEINANKSIQENFADIIKKLESFVKLQR